MAFLNGGGSNGDAKFLDMQRGPHNDHDGMLNGAGAANGGAPAFAAGRPPAKRSGCSLGTALGSLGLLLGVVSLILSIYAASVARKNAGGGAVLTSAPRGGPAGAVPTRLGAYGGYYAPLQAMKYPRSDFRAIPVGSSIFLIGGITNARAAAGAPGAKGSATGADAASKGVVIANVVRYDTYRGLVSEAAPLPAPRARFAAAADADGNIYVVGGMDSTAEDAAPSGSVFKYSPTANRWAALPRPIPTPRSDACAAVLDGKLYVMGGYSKNYAQNLGGEVLDLSTGRWASVPDGMTGRGDVECAVLEAAAGRGACVAVLGGWGPNEEFSSLAECFEPAANSWRKLASMTRARGDFAAEALPGDRIVVLGGESGEGKATNETAMRWVEEYDAAADVWSPKAPLPEARFRFDAAHVNNMVFVLGGQPTCTNAPGDAEALGRQACGQVALDSVWGYYDAPTPSVYVWTKPAA